MLPKVIPFVHEGLGNTSYLISLEDGRALLIDPDRAIERYLRIAESLGLRVVAAFETHLHADFVSGSREVAAATGAQVFVPEAARSSFPHIPVAPSKPIALGGVQMEPVGSPGHTPEHLAYVIRAVGCPPLLFSGGSLIVGGAARTDLIAPAMTTELTRLQFRTLSAAFELLPDETILYPTHGVGSFCSAGGGSLRSSTLGSERRDNPVLQFADEGEFVRWFPTTFPGAPEYYFRMRAVNQAGPRLRREVALPKRIQPSDLHSMGADTLVIDVRSRQAYSRGHIHGSLSIPFRDAFCVWLGWLAPPDVNIVFLTEGVAIERVTDEALLVGYERFGGWMDAKMSLVAHGRRSLLESAPEARRALKKGAFAIDVREPTEFAAGRILDAVNIPVGRLPAELSRVPHDRSVVVYCGVGDRASTAASILECAGIDDVLNLNGGFDAWRDAGYPVETQAID